MEVLQTSNYYIFVKNEKTLWWNRSTSEFSIKAGKDIHMIHSFLKEISIDMKSGRIFSLNDISKIHD